MFKEETKNFGQKILGTKWPHCVWSRFIRYHTEETADKQQHSSTADNPLRTVRDANPNVDLYTPCVLYCTVASPSNERAVTTLPHCTCTAAVNRIIAASYLFDRFTLHRLQASERPLTSSSIVRDSSTYVKKPSRVPVRCFSCRLVVYIRGQVQVGTGTKWIAGSEGIPMHYRKLSNKDRKGRVEDRLEKN